MTLLWSPLVVVVGGGLRHPPGGFRRIQSCPCLSLSLPPPSPLPPATGTSSAGRGYLSPSTPPISSPTSKHVNAGENQKPPSQPELPQRQSRALARPSAPPPPPLWGGLRDDAEETLHPSACVHLGPPPLRERPIRPCLCLLICAMGRVTGLASQMMHMWF